jgi:hypothetical protein
MFLQKGFHDFTQDQGTGLFQKPEILKFRLEFLRDWHLVMKKGYGSVGALRSKEVPVQVLSTMCAVCEDAEDVIHWVENDLCTNALQPFSHMAVC